MSFASPVFLWYFMPAVLVLSFVLPRTWRNGLIAASSLLFYAWGGGEFVFLLIGCMFVNFVAGLAIDSEWAANRLRRRKAILIATLVFDVGILAVWKYAGFFSAQVSRISDALGAGATDIIALALPIGISFYTFHHMSYVVDVYRRTKRAQRSPLQFVTYIGMFPQLIAGPIVRYHEIADQLSDTHRDRLADLSRGFPRFAFGLAKKVIVADAVAPIADAAFATPPGELTTAVAWTGILAYTIQIYFDFSAYTDMAIGLAQMFGFRLPENFDRPYSSYSITDFWRRWHMSLSRWFRDYVYIPLGGNRKGTGRTYLNLTIVFFLTGIWHGAAWTFLVWGMFHGALMVIERFTGVGTREPRSVVEDVLRRALTLLLVMIGWVFFRAAAIGQAFGYLHTMFVPRFGPVSDAMLAAASTQATVMLAIGALVVFLPRRYVAGRVIERFDKAPGKVLRVAVIGVLTPYAAILVAAGTFSPFLYFQF